MESPMHTLEIACLVGTSNLGTDNGVPKVPILFGSMSEWYNLCSILRRRKMKKMNNKKVW